MEEFAIYPEYFFSFYFHCTKEYSDFFFFFCLFAFSRAAPAACGGSQARGPIVAVATGQI